jgi:phage terminase large subunit-like protein
LELKPRIPILEFTEHVLGLDLYPEQKVILKEFWEGGSEGDLGAYNYGIFALGRRSGKTLLGAISAVYGATVMDPIYRQFLRKNETFRIVTVANSEDQAKIAFGMIVQLMEDSPFSHLIEKKLALSLTLTNGVEITAMPASARASRGAAIPLMLLDELAFAMGGGEVNSGGEAIYKALSPSMAQFGQYGKLMALSSPGLRQGIFYNLYEQSCAVRSDGVKEYPNMYGVKRATWEVNPRISQAFLDAERKRDPDMFDVEYGANFIENAQGLVDSRIIDDSVSYLRVFGKPNDIYYGQYILSLDPAKGNRDDYTACLMHFEGRKLIVDLWHEFEATKRVVKMGVKGESEVMQVDVNLVHEWILDIHNRFGIGKAAMDQYSSMASIQVLQDHLDIIEFSWSQQTKTKAYSKMREMFNADEIVLPPNEKAIKQLKNLTVMFRPSGQWVVTGGDKAAVDDYCAAMAAGVLIIESPEQAIDWIDAVAS